MYDLPTKKNKSFHKSKNLLKTKSKIKLTNQMICYTIYNYAQVAKMILGFLKIPTIPIDFIQKMFSYIRLIIFAFKEHINF